MVRAAQGAQALIGLLVALLIGSSPTSADPFASLTAKEMARLVATKGAGYCLGYVSGLGDGVVAGAGQPPLRRYCLPEIIRKDQEVRVVEKFLREHPSRLHLKESVLVVAAFVDAWPCPQSRDVE